MDLDDNKYSRDVSFTKEICVIILRVYPRRILVIGALAKQLFFA